MNTRGFSLVEMIVVVAVVGILATIIVLQFSGTNRNFSIQNAQSIIRSDIRQAMTYAATGKTCCAGNAAPAGYGVVFTPGSSSYVLYADIDGDHVYTASSADEITDTVDLPVDELIPNVNIQSCDPGAVEGGPCDLLVTVPSGVMYANGSNTKQLTVTVVQTQNAETATLTVDLHSGQID